MTSTAHSSRLYELEAATITRARLHAAGVPRSLPLSLPPIRSLGSSMCHPARRLCSMCPRDDINNPCHVPSVYLCRPRLIKAQLIRVPAKLLAMQTGSSSSAPGTTSADRMPCAVIATLGAAIGEAVTPLPISFATGTQYKQPTESATARF